MEPNLFLRGFVAAVLVSPAFVASASAQVYAVHFKDPKTAKKYPTACVTLQDGSVVLVGEAKDGITLNGRTINYRGEKGVNELWAVNTGDPMAVPYKLVGESYEPAKVRNGVAAFLGSAVEKIEIYLDRKSLHGLASEYGLRRNAFEAAQKARDAYKAGTPEWSAAHARLLGEMERLHAWLEKSCFPDAAKKLDAELQKQKKTVAKEAYAQRLASALASVQAVPTPANLVELGRKLAPGTEFHVQESRHLRVTYDTRLADEPVKELLELAETMIDGFRTEVVDPHLGEDFQDGIPEERFIEFWFGPDDLVAHERFLVDWYGVQWGNHVKERVAAMSGRFRKAQAPEYLDYWKVSDNKDFDAIIAHELGHVLANLHYNRGRKQDLPPWLEEAVGYWLAISYVGKNGVNCGQFEDADYGKAQKNKVERAIFMGESELYTTVALEHGPPSDQLLRKPLHQMGDGDFAKSWSFFEWVAKEEGRKGQVWLRALCDVFVESGPSLDQFRAASEQALDVTGEDVFKVVDERWKKRARQIEKGGLEPRKQ